MTVFPQVRGECDKQLPLRPEPHRFEAASASMARVEYAVLKLVQRPITQTIVVDPELIELDEAWLVLPPQQVG